MRCHLLLAVGLAALAACPAHAQAQAPTASVAALKQVEEGAVRPVPASAPVPSAAAPVIYFAADEPPRFPGGDAALLKFLTSKLKYPAAALDRSLSGKVHVAFTVDPEGHLHDPRVVRGLGAGLDEEALRLVRIMPWWTPGTIQGRPVWVSVTMPIVFRAL